MIVSVKSGYTTSFFADILEDITVTTLGKLVEVEDLRNVWPHEACDFTPWLSQEENIALLADAVGLDEITVEETESPVGDFNVDIYASETGTGRRVIVENQLEDTNHDHLGKLITYASGKDANVIIWVVRRAREEHKSAIEWLNNHTDDSLGFFLCEIKLYKIGNSAPAVKFEVIEKPNDWVKEVKKNEYTSDTHKQRYEYWQSFQEYAFKNSDFAKAFHRRKPSKDHWLTFSIGVSSCRISVAQIKRRNEINVALLIDDDKDLFDVLYRNKEHIEQDSELKFDWRRMSEKKSSCIIITRSANLAEKEEWPVQFDWLIDMMLRIKRSFKKYL